jgi:hypothetical protein
MLASEMFLLSFLFAFQSMRAGEPLDCSQALSSANAFDDTVLLSSRRSCRCAEYSSRISDLEGRLSLAKCQAQMAMDKASISYDLMK